MKTMNDISSLWNSNEFCKTVDSSEIHNVLCQYPYMCDCFCLSVSDSVIDWWIV